VGEAWQPDFAHSGTQMMADYQPTLDIFGENFFEELFKVSFGLLSPQLLDKTLASKTSML
jgi:hypothetical protein